VEESLEAVEAWRMYEGSAPSLFGLELDADTLIAGMEPSVTTPGAWRHETLDIIPRTTRLASFESREARAARGLWPIVHPEQLSPAPVYDDEIFALLRDSAKIAKATAAKALEAATSRHRDDGSGGGSAGSAPPSAAVGASAPVLAARGQEADPPPTSPSRRGGGDVGGTPVEATEADATPRMSCAVPPPRSFGLRARRARAVAKVVLKKATSAAVAATARRVAGRRVAPPKRARPPPDERPGVAEERAERARASPHPGRTLYFALGCAAGGDAEGAAQVRGVVVAGGCDVDGERLGKFGRRFPGAATHCADALANYGINQSIN